MSILRKFDGVFFLRKFLAKQQDEVKANYREL